MADEHSESAGQHFMQATSLKTASSHGQGPGGQLLNNDFTQPSMEDLEADAMDSEILSSRKTDSPTHHPRPKVRVGAGPTASQRQKQKMNRSTSGTKTGPKARPKVPQPRKTVSNRSQSRDGMRHSRQSAPTQPNTGETAAPHGAANTTAPVLQSDPQRGDPGIPPSSLSLGAPIVMAQSVASLGSELPVDTRARPAESGSRKPRTFAVDPKLIPPISPTKRSQDVSQGRSRTTGGLSPFVVDGSTHSRLDLGPGPSDALPAASGLSMPSIESLVRSRRPRHRTISDTFSYMDQQDSLYVPSDGPPMREGFGRTVPRLDELSMGSYEQVTERSGGLSARRVGKSEPDGIRSQGAIDHQSSQPRGTSDPADHPLGSVHESGSLTGEDAVITGSEAARVVGQLPHEAVQAATRELHQLLLEHVVLTQLDPHTYGSLNVMELIPYPFPFETIIATAVDQPQQYSEAIRAVEAQQDGVIGSKLPDARARSRAARSSVVQELIRGGATDIASVVTDADSSHRSVQDAEADEGVEEMSEEEGGMGLDAVEGGEVRTQALQESVLITGRTSGIAERARASDQRVQRDTLARLALRRGQAKLLGEEDGNLVIVPAASTAASTMDPVKRLAQIVLAKGEVAGMDESMEGGSIQFRLPSAAQMDKLIKSTMPTLLQAVPRRDARVIFLRYVLELCSRR